MPFQLQRNSKRHSTLMIIQQIKITEIILTHFNVTDDKIILARIC